MAQILSRGGPDPVTTGVLTVAELLNRNAPVAVQPEPEPPTAPGVTVGSLLRREGRAPKAENSPKAEKKKAGEQGKKPTDPHAAAHRRVLVRRGAIAAGALLAAGSVVGGVVLTNATPTPVSKQDPLADPGYPGEGRLDQTGDTAPVAPAVVDPAPANNPLDAGVAPPTNWTPVAFPTADNADGDSSAQDAAKSDDSDGGSGHGTTTSDNDGGSSAKDASADKKKESSATDDSKEKSSETKSESSDDKDDAEKTSAPQQSDDSDSAKSGDDDEDDGLVGSALKSVGKTAAGLLGG